MTTPTPDISSLLDQLREQWLEVVKERDDLRAGETRLKGTLTTLREMFDHLTLLSSVEQCHAQAKVGMRVVDAAINDQNRRSE